MPKRSYSGAGSYRYGFNGKENDNDVKGLGNQQDYGMRIYDPRIGKFLSVDPLQESYPELSAYQFSHNSPIDGIDLDGLERIDFRLIKKDDGTTSITNVTSGPSTIDLSSFKGLFGHDYKNVPTYYRVEYNNEHFYFTDGKNIQDLEKSQVIKIDDQHNHDENALNFTLFSLHDLDDFLSGPEVFASTHNGSAEDVYDEFKSAVLINTALALSGRAAEGAVGFRLPGSIDRGRSTPTAKTNEQAAAANNNNASATQGNTAIGGKITGYTKHGLNQAIGRNGGRGVKASAILDAVKNPIKVTAGSSQGSTMYKGKKAKVVLNQNGEVITTAGSNRGTQQQAYHADKRNSGGGGAQRKANKKGFSYNPRAIR